MGYYSDGYGCFKLRNGKDEKQAIKTVISEEFDISKNLDGTYTIKFTGWRMYYAGKSLKKVMEYFDGEFQVFGEEAMDMWKLKFQNGKAYIIEMQKIVWKNQKEIDLDSDEWN